MTATRIGSFIESEQAIWLLYRGGGRASLVVPMSLNEHLDGGDEADVFGIPLHRALSLARNFLAGHPGWVAILSIPSRLADRSEETLAHVTQLQDEDYRDIQKLGMDVPLGEWADPSTATLYEIVERGLDAAS